MHCRIISKLVCCDWLILQEKSGARRVMPALSWLPKTQLLRSKPFLVCVVLVLLGLLLVHSSRRKAVLVEWTPEYSQPRSGRHVALGNGSAFDILLTNAFDVIFNATRLNIDLENKTHGKPEAKINVSFETSPEKTRILTKNVSQEEVSKPGGLKYETSSQCTKQINVSFLKVHKAGSTTVMNIFLRFAISHNLNLVLPRNSRGYGFNYLGYGKTVSSDRIVPLPPNERYNILCNHVVYNKEKFREILPPNTSYIGIIREPVSHFISAATYYGFYKRLSINKTQGHVMGDFLRDPSAHAISTSFVRNRMSFDFGIPDSEFENETFIGTYIKELDKDFALVLIMERFPESLVLMRRKLCWSTKDILYVPLNALRSKPEFQLTDEDIHRLRDWNGADFRLYDYFKIKFDQLVKQEGNDLQEEVKSFLEIKKTVAEFCFGESSDFNASFPASKWSAGFNVTLEDCDLMTEDELPLLRNLIDEAWEKYQKSQPLSTSPVSSSIAMPTTTAASTK
ncbi:galactose-3-O-sulfotransferase 2-like isoform X1 [Dreissena polymorpha]|uniref:Galactose-3-O-sulfotransferase n=2 Tax=Dreissena polymorpha TaxID=45954 RepID=A0A9D4BYW2_DREPO|nr:galactose-3-O-sulfotransferase 2-like isoform X1 [Dreissena polymorpha]KAH3713500.1 hypothetical protein DPMN_073292 [Dreissena polymorpha]